jgi:murein DD-endopeptidase MepM/ murein hydrolase activator NlpD
MTGLHELRLFIVLTCLLASVNGRAAIPSLESLPESTLVPGGIAVIATQENAFRATYQNNRVMLVSFQGSHYAIVGIPLDARPGSHSLSLELADGERQNRVFSVSDKRYMEQRLIISNERQVNPNNEDMLRINRETAEMNEAFASWNESLTPVFTMLAPVAGVRSSSFGLRRYFNDQPRSPHSGMDIAADEGTAIYAPAPGVILSTGNYFFNGNTVIIDHGHGMISLYCHMNTIDVVAGTHVKTGDQIGLVGQTGRVTGPHLHWSINLNTVRVDPELFLPE